MKTYLFTIINWKSDNNKPFYIRKAFPSVYLADRWATRITFEKKGSPYSVILEYGKEI